MRCPACSARANYDPPDHLDEIEPVDLEPPPDSFWLTEAELDASLEMADDQTAPLLRKFVARGPGSAGVVVDVEAQQPRGRAEAVQCGMADNEGDGTEMQASLRRSQALMAKSKWLKEDDGVVFLEVTSGCPQTQVKRIMEWARARSERLHQNCPAGSVLCMILILISRYYV